MMLSRSRAPIARCASVIAAIALSGLTTSVSAQAHVDLPPVTILGPRVTAVPPVAEEAHENLGAERDLTSTMAMRVMSAHYPKDSMRAVAAARAEAWMTTLRATPVTGIQVDPYSWIAVTANQDGVAQQQIAARLAIPGLSVPDRAYTLQHAVQVFADADVPSRLPIAEQYLKQLDALGTEAAYWQFTARYPLLYAYYRLGRSTDVARLGLRAFELVEQMPYLSRGAFYEDSFLYTATVDGLLRQPNGRATVRALNARLLAEASPSAEVIARDSSLRYYPAERWKGLIQAYASVSERMGQAGTPLAASYWVNRGSTRDSQSVAVTDGKIRILEIGSFTCAPCMAAVPALERLHQRFPAIEVDFMTSTQGWWGNRVIEPRAEAERLADHFLTVKHATFPIGIAFAPRAPDDDGGAMPVVATTTWHADNYPQISKPTFYILDGHGTIRRVIAGYNRDLENSLADVVEFLRHEAQQDGPASPVASGAATSSTR